MLAEEYKQRAKDLQSQYNANNRALMVEYAKANAKAELGDIVIDTISDEVFTVGQRILHIDSSTSLPNFQYKGIRLKKDLSPMAKPGESYSFDPRVRVIKKASDAK